MEQTSYTPSGQMYGHNWEYLQQANQDFIKNFVYFQTPNI